MKLPFQVDLEVPSLVEEVGYVCLKRIGSGGYGSVYLLRKAEKGARQYVAGKFIHKGAFDSLPDETRNGSYQRAMEGLHNFRSLTTQSPFLLQTFEVRIREDKGYFCYMMELADDLHRMRKIMPDSYIPRTLKHELEKNGKRERLPAQRCVEIGVTLAKGLQLLHENGFNHRDVRPSNIIFVNNLAKLADIDLLAGHSHDLPSYIPRDYAAPETSHSARADIFSLGKVIYEMCTGLPVKAYPTLPPDIRHWPDHRLLLRINKVILQACARESLRYASAAEMIDALGAVI